MDSRARNLNVQATENPTAHMLSAVDGHDHTIITIAKYLPIHIFKNPLTLTTALDQIYQDSRRMQRPVMNTMLVNLAKNIALTTQELNIDYGTKLALIRAALSHRLFNSSNVFKIFINFMIKRILKIHSRTEAQIILDDAIANIRQSRNNIILC